jgi:chromosomal replication initiation ATPase DnaA
MPGITRERVTVKGRSADVFTLQAKTDAERMAVVKAAVSQAYRLPIADIVSEGMTKPLKQARLALYRLSKQFLPDARPSAIARLIGKPHSTYSCGIDSAERMINSGPQEWRDAYAAAEAKCREMIK